MKLSELAQPQSARGAPTAVELCDLCGAEVESEHRHLVDLERRRLLCACRACAILFDRGAAGGGHFRLVPERTLALPDFRLADERWAALAIPVGLAFFFRSTPAGRVVAFYPSPLGATESLLELEVWEAIEADNPILGTIEPDVEALLVNRARAVEEHLIVPIDDCYALVGLIRRHWKGFGGGDEAWRAIDDFFTGLHKRAVVTTFDGEEARWQT
jgi:uncharacterized protein DUF5947